MIVLALIGSLLEICILSLMGHHSQISSINNLISIMCMTRCSYVVDAADHDNISISKSELHDLLSKPSLSGIPLLVLGNKIDKPQALSKQALTDQMYVQH